MSPRRHSPSVAIDSMSPSSSVPIYAVIDSQHLPVNLQSPLVQSNSESTHADSPPKSVDAAEFSDSRGLRPITFQERKHDWFRHPSDSAPPGVDLTCTSGVDDQQTLILTEYESLCRHQRRCDATYCYVCKFAFNAAAGSSYISDTIRVPRCTPDSDLEVPVPASW
jgi:hypothetical protein